MSRAPASTDCGRQRILANAIASLSQRANRSTPPPMRLLTLLLATHAYSCSAYSLLDARCAARRLQATAATRGRAAVPVADARFDGEEMDAMDTSDSWDDQLAMQQAWLAAQKKTQGEAPDPEPEADGLSVDEEAHYDFDEPGDNVGYDWRAVRAGVTGKRASELSILSGMIGRPPSSPPPAPAAADAGTLEAVVRTLARLEEKIDRIEKAMGIETPSPPPAAAAPPSPPPAGAEPTAKAAPKPPAKAPKKPSAPLAPRTMAEDEPHVDESAYMDDDPDDQDLGDWRVVRRLNNLFSDEKEEK